MKLFLTFADLDVPTLKLTPPSLHYMGDTIVMECKATGTPPIVYSILRGHTVISTNNNFLILNNITRHDDGEYICEVANVSGKKKSKHVQVNVQC